MRVGGPLDRNAVNEGGQELPPKPLKRLKNIIKGRIRHVVDLAARVFPRLSVSTALVVRFRGDEGPCAELVAGSTQDFCGPDSRTWLVQAAPKHK